MSKRAEARRADRARVERDKANEAVFNANPPLYLAQMMLQTDHPTLVAVKTLGYLASWGVLEEEALQAIKDVAIAEPALAEDGAQDEAGEPEVSGSLSPVPELDETDEVAE